MKADALRKLFRNWPGVTEDVKWGNDLVFSVGGKMFCVTDTSDSGRLSFKVDDERFLELTDRPGIVPAPYLARARWISLIDTRVMPRKELEVLLQRSYELVRDRLPKSVRSGLSEA